MKSVYILIITLLTVMPCFAQYDKVSDNKAVCNVDYTLFQHQADSLFNFDWRFMLVTDDNKNTDFASVSLDDNNWRPLDLPHDFQFERPWDEKASKARGFKPMCDGWYRKHFTANPSWHGKVITLDFGGIIYFGDVYINGVKIASTDYGYIGLEADISKHLRYGEDNVVAVYASTGPQKGSRWYTGGGLFRDVRMKIDNPTHIARHGLYITTPEVSLDSATVRIQVEVENWKNHDARIYAVLRDMNGEIVGTTQGAMPQHNHQTVAEVTLNDINVTDPNLWSPDTPYLYTVEVSLIADGIVVDKECDQIGIRSLEFSPEFGFKLNGEKIFLKGNANHHDMGALGAAAYDTAIERMMRQLKSFGYNTIRCSHNPYSDSFARIADQVGLLIVDELTDKWSDNDYWGGRQPFMNIWPELIIEWVKRDRNRASVIMWSLGNELQIRDGWSGFKGTNDWGVTTYRIFDQMVKRFDPTRKTTVAMYPARAGAIAKNDKEFNEYLVPPELACATEIASFNYQSDKFAKYLEYKPDMILFQSEAETYKLLEPLWNMDYDRSVGMAYWGSIEYWGESNAWPKKGWNYSFFDHTLAPVPQAYLVRSAFIPDVPQVHIGVVDNKGGESMSWNDAIVGRVNLHENWNLPKWCKVSLFTYTNQPSVELLVNGKSLGIQYNDTADNKKRNIVYWQDIDYGKGGSIVAIARDATGNETARHTLNTSGNATELAVVIENPGSWRANGMDLQYINITAIDNQGNRVYGFEEPITVEVEGAATLLALDNADHYTDELFYGINTKKMKEGRIQLILRSGHEHGEVKLNLKTPYLRQTSVIDL